jgi:hypothetical protein
MGMKAFLTVVALSLFSTLCLAGTEMAGEWKGIPLQASPRQSQPIEEAAIEMLKSASFEATPAFAQERGKTACSGTYVRVFFPGPRTFVSLHSHIGNITADEIIVCTRKEEDGSTFNDYIMVKLNGTYRAFAMWDPRADAALWNASEKVSR